MKKRRWLSILLSISIIVCLLPTVVAADGLTWTELQEQFFSANSGDVINVSSTVVAGQDDQFLLVPPGKKITLNFQNYATMARSCNGPSSGGSMIVVQGELVLTGEGVLTSGFSMGYGGGIYVGQNGKLTIDGEDIIITNCRSVADGGAIFVEGGGELIMNGSCSVSGSVYGSAHGGAIYLSNGAQFSISGDIEIGGNHYESVDSNDYDRYDGLYLESEARIHVTGDLTGSHISVNTHFDHDGVITSSLRGNGDQWNFRSDDDHGFNIQLNSAGEAYLNKRIWHTITITSPDPHGTISQSDTEHELGKYPGLTANADAGYCLTSIKEIGVSDPVRIRRYYGKTTSYVVDGMPDRDMTVEVVWTPIADTVIVKAANLTLNGKIRINIKMLVPDAIANDPGAQVQITYRGESRLVPLSSLSKEGDLYVVSQPCTVREFACPVAVRVLDGNGEMCIMTSETTKNVCINEETTYAWVDGQYVSVSNPDGTGNNHIVNEFTYSIEDYKDTVKKGSNANLKRLIESMNYYCNDAWAFFQAYNGVQDHSFVDYNTTPSTTYQSKFNAVTVSSLEQYKPTVEGSVTGVTVDEMRLSLDSDTMITVRFNLEDGVTKDDVRFMCPGYNLIVEQEGNSLIVKIDNINAVNLDHVFSINVYRGSERMTFSCSALSYAYLVLSHESEQPASYRTQIIDLVRSLTVYSNEAHRYFD